LDFFEIYKLTHSENLKFEFVISIQIKIEKFTMSTPINLSTLPLPSKKGESTNQSFESLLNKYAEKLNLSKKNLDILLNIKKNGEYLLNYSNIGFVYEVFSMLHVLGFDETLSYLESLEVPGKVSSKSILDSVLFEREETMYQAETSRIRDEFQVKVDGSNKCGKCGGYNTIAIISARQRSADEALIYDITCQDCGNRFKR